MKSFNTNSYFGVNSEDYNYVLNNLFFKISKLRKTKILISGGSGFIGKWLIGSILNINDVYQLNIEIFILSRNPNKFINDNKWINNERNLKILKFDLSKEKLNFDHNFDYFFHLANDPNNEKYNDIFYQLNYNLKINENVINFCENNINKKVFFCSSGVVKNITYKNELNLNNSYGIMKLISERIFLNNKKIKNKLMIGRLYACCGPLIPLKTHYAFNSFLNNIINNKNVLIKGNGKTIRSYIYSSTMSACILNLTFGQKYKENVYEIGSSRGISMYDLAKKLMNKAGSKKKVIIVNKLRNEFNHKYYTKNDICDVLSINRISLDTAIEKCFKFYKNIT